MKNPIYYLNSLGLTKKILLILFSPFVFTLGLNGQDEDIDNSTIQFRHAINVCPIAPVFGIYSVNYENLFAPHHGMVFRYEYESIPKTYTEANIEANGMAFTLNYRYHRKMDLNSSYIGSYARYRIYSGDGITEGASFDFDRKDFTLGLNAGKRWIFKKGFNINIMFGYGYSFVNLESQPSSSSIETLIKEFEKDYDFLGAFLGEVSIGYAF